MNFNTDGDMENLFNNLFGSSGENTTIIDTQYKKVKSKSNLKLCKMKSGNFKILNYYNQQVGETYFDLTSAKKAYIKLHLG